MTESSPAKKRPLSMSPEELEEAAARLIERSNLSPTVHPAIVARVGALLRMNGCLAPPGD
jgi:hypothetical protein